MTKVDMSLATGIYLLTKSLKNLWVHRTMRVSTN